MHREEHSFGTNDQFADGSLVAVFAANDSIEAAIVKGVLDGAGIPAITGYPFGLGEENCISPFSDNRVYVLERDVDEAKRVIDSYEKRNQPDL